MKFIGKLVRFLVIFFAVTVLSTVYAKVAISDVRIGCSLPKNEVRQEFEGRPNIAFTLMSVNIRKDEEDVLIDGDPEFSFVLLSKAKVEDEIFEEEILADENITNSNVPFVSVNCIPGGRFQMWLKGDPPAQLVCNKGEGLGVNLVLSERRKHSAYMYAGKLITYIDEEEDGFLGESDSKSSFASRVFMGIGSLVKFGLIFEGGK